MNVKTISLDGTWTLYSDSGYRSVPRCETTVPGTVAQTMEKYTGPLTDGHGCLNARWIEEQLWIYERVFTLDAEDIHRKIRIVFDGLDLTAKIIVNGKQACTHNNFYTPCRADVTDLIKEGKNQLRVEIESGLHYAAGKKVEDLYPSPWEFDNDLHRREWLRKPQSSFEWDWSPRLVNVGIYKSCRIEITDGVFYDECSVLSDVADDYSSAKIEVRAFVSTYCSPVACSLEVSVAETGQTVNSEYSIANGAYIGASVEIISPKLWHVREYGEQNRYTLHITLRHNGETVACFDKKIGLRRVEIDKSPHPDGGNYFIVKINRIKVFAKGGNMVPADIVYSRLTRDVYEILIERACECNFNALRVWGGGLYETDDFYDLCDEKGILVWQDFIGACANYPGYDNEFYKNYLDEITHQIRRLSSFASLVILSGNNEIDWQSRNMLNNNLSKYPDAVLYYVTIPQTLLAEGFKCYYQPSSPWSEDMSYANNTLIGDQHPWDIGFSDKDYFKYRNFICRFPNEGGVLGSTSLPNTMRALSQGQEYIGSFDWQLHSNSIEQRNPQKLMLKEKLGMSDEIFDTLSIPEFIYYIGLCQGEGFREYILNFRRRMFDCASAIFWMYNDCWPAVTSWTVVDYERRRTPSYYPVKNAFAPVSVDIVKDTDNYTIYGINDRLCDKKATLEYGAFTPDGKYITYTAEITLEANSSVPVAKINNIPNGYIPYAILSAEDEPVARRRYIESAYNSIGIEKCTIDIKINGSYATYTADKFVMCVCIDLDGEENSDNFFDLYPDKPYIVKLSENCSGKILFSYQG